MTLDTTTAMPTESQPVQTYTLRESVKKALSNYFSKLGDQTPNELYDMVSLEVEPPLLEAVMSFTRGNQSKAAIILGISRGTLRKKLKQYDMD